MPRLPVVPAAAALPVWIGNLAVWHIPAVMEAALHHGAVHVAQHLCLFAAGLLLWCAILSSELGVGARLGIVAGMMATGIALSSVLIWWPRVLYSTYTHADILGGLSPLTDQRTGEFFNPTSSRTSSASVVAITFVPRAAPRLSITRTGSPGYTRGSSLFLVLGKMQLMP